MFNIEGKRALVTGASGGIGRAIAAGLARQGARIALSGTRIPALEEIAAEISGEAVIAAGDLSSAEGAEAVMAAAAEKLGGVDILVNNAGITRDMLALRLKDEDWDKVLEVNLTAAFRLSRAAMRGMMKARWGRIISITSVVGVTGNPGQANYCAAKAGLIGMSKSMAHELASRNITVNCVAPGFIATPMTDALTEQQRTAIMERVPAGRLGEGSDIAAAVAYLASDEAGYITGQTLHVNGGMAMI
jgi:3-oxoacyl-[acyl-carrier protein] reductase